MKIRSDFVTNSSSSSFTTFTVKSKLLADIISEELNSGKTLDESSLFWAYISVKGDTVSYREGPGDISYSFSGEEYVCPQNVFQVFDHINWMIKALEDNDDYWGWEDIVTDSRASRTIEALSKHDPEGAAASIMKCSWSSGEGGHGEFMPQYYQGLCWADEIVLKGLNVKDRSQVSEEEYDRYVFDHFSSWVEESSYEFDRKKGIDEYKHSERHFY